MVSLDLELEVLNSEIQTLTKSVAAKTSTSSATSTSEKKLNVQLAILQTKLSSVLGPTVAAFTVTQMK